MSTSRCLRCGQPADTLAASGLCETCVGVSDETRHINPAAGTDTYDPVGPETGFGVLPPGGYRYEEQIGAGGMGVVWRAVRVSTGQVVAIKKLRAECFTAALLRRFVAEARTLAAVIHPNVVRLDDFIPDPADPFLVLEFVPGESLAHHLKTAGPLHPDRAARLTAEAARGVQAAHDAGVIHRDLKPGNLLVTPDGKVKVADFGLSKQLAEVEAEEPLSAAGGTSSAPTVSLTAVGRLAGGTPGFMAPEQVDESFGPVGPPADVWGLGACLFNLLVGQLPFPPGRENLERVTTDPLVPPHELNPAIPADLSEVVAKCLRKRPADRYPTAAALAEDLDRYLARGSTTARPHPWLTRAWRRVRRAPILAALIGAVVTATAVAGVVVLMNANPPDPLDEHRTALRAGRPVTLVSTDGLPRWHHWMAGGALFSPNEMRDGGIQFQTAEDSYLALLDDPVVDSFRLEAELRHVAARPPAGRVGLFVGFADHPDPAGGVTRCSCRWQFSDYWDASELEEVVQPSHAAVLVSQPEFQAVAGDVPKVRDTYLDRYRFPPALLAGGKWRKVAVEVTAGGVTAFWWDDKANQWVRAARGDAARIDTKRREWADGLAEAFARPVRPPVWSPRGALGVYASNGTVCLRNVTLTPLE